MKPASIDLAVIIGTRPEAIKLAPVVLAASARPDEFSVRVIRTGQHRELVDRLLAEFDIEAEADLQVMQHDQDLAHVMAESLRGLATLFARRRPDWVLVQGDTTSAFAGALAAFYQGVRLGHVEAGLRSGDLRSPFPEEAHRSLTARIAELHFAPTPQARAHLLREGIVDADVFVTGNTVVDALHWTIARGLPPNAIPNATSHRPYVLVTSHRRENHGPALDAICDGLLGLLARNPSLDVWIPMHPNPRVRQVLRQRLGAESRVRLTEPLDYRDFVHALNGARLVLTDSGGVQEECAALGKPVLVLRQQTERPEVLEAGVAALVGNDAALIADAATSLLSDPARYEAMSRPSNVFGDGTASTRVLDALAERHHRRQRDAPKATPL